MANLKRLNSSKEGISASVPQDKASDIMVESKGLTEGQVSDLMRQVSSNFHPQRILANIGLKDTKRGVYVKKFDQAFKLHIPYEKQDSDRAKKAGKNLKMAYWNNEDWQVLNGGGLDVTKAPHSGVIEVEIYEWLGDPPIALGV